MIGRPDLRRSDPVAIASSARTSPGPRAAKAPGAYRSGPSSVVDLRSSAAARNDTAMGGQPAVGCSTSKHPRFPGLGAGCGTAGGSLSAAGLDSALSWPPFGRPEYGTHHCRQIAPIWVICVHLAADVSSEACPALACKRAPWTLSTECGSSVGFSSTIQFERPPVRCTHAAQVR